MQTELYFRKPLMGMYQKQLSIVEDYYLKTNPQFLNIENEADEYVNSFYENYPASENIDLGDVADWALEKGIERYETLSIMKKNHLLMTISMLYHIWEQQLIKFTIHEMEHYFTFETKSLLYSNVQTIFRLHNVDITCTQAWNKLKELKALVNTIKHGDGESAKKLRKIRPDFFQNDLIFVADTLELSGSVLLNEYSLQVEEKDLYDYIKATKDFWLEMPEKAYSTTEVIQNQLKKNK